MIKTAEIDRAKFRASPQARSGGARIAFGAAAILHLLVVGALAAITLSAVPVHRRPASPQLQMDLSALHSETQSRPASEIVARPPELHPHATPYQIRELPYEPVPIAATVDPPVFEFQPETDFPAQILPIPEPQQEAETAPAKSVAQKPKPRPRTETSSSTFNSRPPFVQATVRSRARVSYPESARKRGQQGTTHVRVDVSPSGRVTNAGISRSSGNATLDKAALKAAAKWQFNPASRGGQAASSQLVIPITFRLE